MKGRRNQNWIPSLDAGTAGAPAPDALPQAALGWLHEILQSEFATGHNLETQPRALSGHPDCRREEWLRLLARVEVLALTDPLTGLAGPGQLGVVLDHAWTIAEGGDPLTLVAVELDKTRMATTTGAYQRVLCDAARILRKETQSCGITLRHTAYEFLLVLPHLDVPGAEGLLARSRERLGEQARLHAGIAAYTPEVTSADQLLEAAGQALVTSRS